MTLQQARKLRDHIRTHGVKATVPLVRNEYGGYMVKMRDGSGWVIFSEWDQFKCFCERQRRQLQHFINQHLPRDSRSPIEIMIDKVTGYDQGPKGK